jgi:polar amino acid transport system substrate-binding protein
MRKKILSILVIMSLVLSLSACSGRTSETSDANNSKSEQPSESVQPSESSEQPDSSKGTFIVGFDQNFPPMGFIGEDGEFTGFDLELAAEAAKRMNLELVLQPIAWDSKDMELESGNIDCVWNGFTINGREDKYTWTEPYMKNEQVFVVRADDGIKSLADLAGKTVVAQTESSADIALKDNPDLVATFGQYMTSPDYETALMDLDAGAVDAVAMDSVVASYKIEKQGKNFDIMEEALAAEEYGVGFLLGNEELRDKVQAVLEEMAADGTMAKISEKWFGEDITTIGK